ERAPEPARALRLEPVHVEPNGPLHKGPIEPKPGVEPGGERHGLALAPLRRAMLLRRPSGTALTMHHEKQPRKILRVDFDRRPVMELHMTDYRTDASFHPSSHPTRREIVVSGAMVPIAMGLSSGAAAQSSTIAATPETVSVNLTINGTGHALMLDPRTTLL